jgi:hypothetical protein
MVNGNGNRDDDPIMERHGQRQVNGDGTSQSTASPWLTAIETVEALFLTLRRLRWTMARKKPIQLRKKKRWNRSMARSEQ